MFMFLRSKKGLACHPATLVSWRHCREEVRVRSWMQSPSSHGSIQNNIEVPSPMMHCIKAQKNAIVVASSLMAFSTTNVKSLCDEATPTVALALTPFFWCP
jgi:hypothetical protein